MKCSIWFQDFSASVELSQREEWKLVTGGSFLFLSVKSLVSQFLQEISITFNIERGQRLIHFLSEGRKKTHSICDIHTEITASHKHSASLVRCVDHCDTLWGELCGVQKWQFKLSCWSSP